MATNASNRSARRIVRLTVFGVRVELRTRDWKRWTVPRYEIFVGGGRRSTGMVWRQKSRWASTLVDGPPTFPTRRQALAAIVRRAVVTLGEPLAQAGPEPEEQTENTGRAPEADQPRPVELALARVDIGERLPRRLVVGDYVLISGHTYQVVSVDETHALATHVGARFARIKDIRPPMTSWDVTICEARCRGCRRLSRGPARLPVARGLVPGEMAGATTQKGPSFQPLVPSAPGVPSSMKRFNNAQRLHPVQGGRPDSNRRRH